MAPTTNFLGHMVEQEEIASPPPVTSAYSSAVDFFVDEPEEKAIVGRKYCYQHTDAIESGGPYSITIAPQGDSFIDPSSFRLCAQFTIKKREGGVLKDLEAKDEKIVAPINCFSKALLEQVDVYLKGRMISKISSPYYDIKAYLETICSYGKDAENGHLNISYFYKDDPGEQDKFTAATHEFSNPAFAKRHEFIAKSKQVFINEPIHTELATMNKLIPSHVPIEFRFNINKVSKFLQYNTGEYEIKFTKFYVLFETVDLAPNLLLATETKFSQKKQAIFPICRGMIKTRQYPALMQSVLWSNLYQGILPETIIICLLDSRAFNGTNNKNYFNFQNFNLSDIELKKNSEPIGHTLHADFENKNAKDLYRHFFDNLGIGTSNTPALISYEDFCDGSMLIPFDLTNDKCALTHNHSKTSGNIDLEIKFKTPLTDGITVLALCSFTDKFFVTGPRSNREVKLMYNI